MRIDNLLFYLVMLWTDPVLCFAMLHACFFASRKDLEEKYDGRLKKEMTGPEQEVITEIIKVLVDKKITVPKSFMGSVE